MWEPLSDPGHAESFDKFGEDYVPLRRLVEQLAHRRYADRVYAFTSLFSLNLTTAPTYQQADGHDVIGIQYDPRRGLFRVKYREWVSPTHNPQYRTVVDRGCEATEVANAIDCCVLRLLLSRRPEPAEPFAAPDRPICGNPLRPVTFSPDWRTDTAVAIARQMDESQDFSAMPILADALQDAGCDCTDILDHCRGASPHVRGCGVVDLLLSKE
jgi:hypothetical protein